MHWDPAQYARYADERGRPFLDLLARVEHPSPRRVVDLGCGSGELTALLATRWPDAVVEGVDSSPQMMAQARSVEGLTFRLGDLETWTVPADADVIISNAALQWVPMHVYLVRTWARSLPPGGWLAFQVPGNFGEPSHSLMRSLATSPRWAPLVGSVLRHQDDVRSPDDYARLLLESGLTVDVWETTYLHVLAGPDPVLDWLRGTGLRPVLAALAGKPAPADAGVGAGGSSAGGTASAADVFQAEFGAMLREAYPATEHGTLFPFRRIFVVAHKP